jgi:hypothetical protein
VTSMPDQALDELPHTVVPPLPGLGVQAGAAGRFAQPWQARTGASASARRRQRLYRLGELVPPDPAAPGWPLTPTVTWREAGDRCGPGDGLS